MQKNYISDYITKKPKEWAKDAPLIEKLTILSESTGHDSSHSVPILLRGITGQSGKLIFAKNSIASFKIMKGDILGVKTTLRKNLLETFIEKQIFIEHTGNRSFLITQKWDKQKTISWGSSLYFVDVIYDICESVGWQLNLTFTLPITSFTPSYFHLGSTLNYLP